jgi:hypothetical protein
MPAGEPVGVELSDDERQLLLTGLMEYGGPGAGATVLAPLVGAQGLDEFFELTDRLSASIRGGEPLSGLDWTRALVLTEICWASDVLGAASEFGSNMSDERALAALRSLQRKLVTGDRIRELLDLQRQTP